MRWRGESSSPKPTISRKPSMLKAGRGNDRSLRTGMTTLARATINPRSPVAYTETRSLASRCLALVRLRPLEHPHG